MEQLIEFFDFNTKSRVKGRKLTGLTMSVWYNKSNGGWNATFSTDITTEKDFIKIGKLGTDLCIAFSDDGIKLRKTTANMMFASKEFVNLVIGDTTAEKMRVVVQLKKINADVYVLSLNL